MTRCLSTRTTTEGFKRRRYEDATGVRFTTIEVPIEVWRHVAPKQKVARALQGRKRAHDQAQVRARASGLLAQGWKPLAVAAELGVTDRAVHKWRRNQQQKEGANAQK